MGERVILPPPPHTPQNGPLKNTPRLGLNGDFKAKSFYYSHYYHWYYVCKLQLFKIKLL